MRSNFVVKVNGYRACQQFALAWLDIRHAFVMSSIIQMVVNMAFVGGGQGKAYPPRCSSLEPIHLVAELSRRHGLWLEGSDLLRLQPFPVVRKASKVLEEDVYIPMLHHQCPSQECSAQFPH